MCSIDYKKFLNINLNVFREEISSKSKDLIMFKKVLYHYWKVTKGNLKNYKLNDTQISLLINTYRTTIPEPGSPFGLLFSMLYFEPKQQTNLNAKRLKVENEKFFKELKTKYHYVRSEKYVKEIYKILHNNRSDNIFINVSQPITYSVFIFKMNETDLNVILNTIKKYCIGIRYEEKGNNKQVISFFTTKNEFYYFLCYLYGCLGKGGVNNADLVFTSVKSLFHKHKKAYIINSTFYLYCLNTGTYLPIINSLKDEVTFNFIKLVSTIMANCDYASLKNFSQYGWGPLSNIIFEAGITSSQKYIKTSEKNKINIIDGLFQNTFLNKPLNNCSLFNNFEIHTKYK